jgi:hypothetical protein
MRVSLEVCGGNLAGLHFKSEPGELMTAVTKHEASVSASRRGYFFELRAWCRSGSALRVSGFTVDSSTGVVP